MSSTFAISASGLAAAGVRLAVSANNVANALSERFVPSRASTEEVAGGGAVARVERLPDPLAEVRADRALSAGLSAVDLVAEVVEQQRAQRAYEANAAALRTADAVEGALVDLFR